MAADHRSRPIAGVVIVLLLSVVPVGSALPGSPASVSVAGVTLLWWYAALVAPLAAAVTVLVTRPLR